MSDTPQSPQQFPLLQTKTGNFSLLANLLLVLSLGCLVLQFMGLLDGINPEKSLLLQFVPGAVGALLIVAFVRKLRKKGELTVWKDRVAGKRPNGLPFDIALVDVAVVELQQRSFALKDAAGGLLLLQRTLKKDDGGLLWLLKEYGLWHTAIWQAYQSTEATAMSKATRHFVGEDGQVSFGDIGFLAEVGGQSWYFPESQCVDVRGLGAGQLRMNQRSRTDANAGLQWDPQPDLLPLIRFVAAVVAASLSVEEKTACMEVLAENHGGCQVRPAAEAGEMEGECCGYAVNIMIA